MSHWEDLEDVYAEWRWERWEEEVEDGECDSDTIIRIHRFNKSIRLEFSHYARLTKIISLEKMSKLENNFMYNFD